VTSVVREMTDSLFPDI